MDFDFANDHDSLKFYKQLEASSRRQPGEGVLHPDACPKLKIQGVPWALPPRGQRIVPRFGDGPVLLDAVDTEEWPEVIDVLGKIVIPAKEICPTCKQPTSRALEATSELLQALLALIARALRTQYSLDDSQLSSMLSFDTGDSPAWLAGVIHWVSGTPRDPNADMLTDTDFTWLEQMAQESTSPEPKRRRRRSRRRHRKRA